MPAATRIASVAIALASSVGVGDQRPGGRQGERAARADPDEPVVRLDHLAGAGDQEGASRIGDRQQGLQPAQDPVAPPLLGQLDRGPPQVAPVLLQPRLEPLEEREGVRRRAGEPRQHALVVDAAHLARRVLEDRRAEADLAVPGHRHAPAVARRRRPSSRGSSERAGHAARPRMGRVVHLRKPVGADVRVALGRRQPRVPEELLDQPQVRAGVQEVGGEGVAEGMRASRARRARPPAPGPGRSGGGCAP